MEKVLITGGAGFIGSVLTKQLLEKGYKVRIMDSLVYDSKPNPEAEFFKGDVRVLNDINRALTGVDAVVHLAAIANDPGVDLDENLSIETNLTATSNVAISAKHKGIKKFVFASSSSIYGAKGDEMANEDSGLNPVSLYAGLKIAAEQALIGISNNGFNPIILRNGTVFGYSDKMRFDLAVNIFALHAYEKGRITVFGGDQWRPNVHVMDVCQAFIKSLESDNTKPEAYNVNGENYKISDISETVRKITGCEVETQVQNKDARSYRTDDSKIRRELGYKPKYDVEYGVKEVIKAIKDGAFDNPLENTKYYCVKHLKTVYNYNN